ncbi:MAG: putative DNA binding CopG/RHH family protein [Arenicella sp.]|jgi:predicted DNA binding CopG/RHH family protein
MKTTQHFSEDYLQRCGQMSTDEIVSFLDDYRKIHGGQPSVSKLISIKVPQNLLDAFKAKARLTGTPYQTQIKMLMRDWIID